MRKLAFIPLFLISFLSCDNSSNLNEDEVAMIQEEITSMFNNYHQAVATDGLLAEFDFLDHSENFYWVPPGYHSALSFDSVEQILRQNNAMLSNVQFEIEELKIFPLTTHVANYTAIINSMMTDTLGDLSTATIIESGTVIKHYNSWKLLNGQSRVLTAKR